MDDSGQKNQSEQIVGTSFYSTVYDDDQYQKAMYGKAVPKSGDLREFYGPGVTGLKPLQEERQPRGREELTSEERKQMPVDRGFNQYFPDAMMLVSMLSARSNEKHAPGQPIQWVKSASADHGDCLARHQLDIGEVDPEMGLDFAVHVAWRAMAQLQTMIEDEGMDYLIDWEWEYNETSD